MKRRIPKYGLHKATGQARVRIDGKTHYLGAYDSPESHRKYDQLIAKWLTGEKLASPSVLTISRLCVKYIEEHAKVYYVKNGRQTSELSAIQGALRPLTRLYGRSKVADFGPVKLKAVREAMIEAGIVRRSINRNISRIRSVFKWGVANELVPVNIHVALTTVTGLRRGRSQAVESAPVKPVPESDIEAVREFVSRQVWTMIQLQLFTGARPGEVRTMRLCEIDMSDETWLYIPNEHKTEHHGRHRVIFIGPRGQELIRPFLKADRERHLFSPAEAEVERRARQREARKSQLTPSQKARVAKPDPIRSAGDLYAKDSYRRSIRRACKHAGIPVWTPGRLRHNAATRLRQQFGIEITRTILGHATAFTTEIYAETDLEKARRVIAAVG